MMAINPADHFGLVHSHAIPFMHRPDIDDIFSAGRVGVIKAARKFDERGQFSTYAKFWIKREILEFVNRKAETIRGSIRAAGTDRQLMASLDADIVGDDGVTSLSYALADPHTPLAGYYFDDLVHEIKRLINEAIDITPTQKAAVLSAISDGEATQQRAEALCRFRQCTSATARKIKEMLCSSSH